MGFLLVEIDPLYKFKSIAHIFTKLGAYLNTCQLIVREVKTITLQIFNKRIGGIGGWGRHPFLFQKQTSSYIFFIPYCHISLSLWFFTKAFQFLCSYVPSFAQ